MKSCHFGLQQAQPGAGIVGQHVLDHGHQIDTFQPGRQQVHIALCGFKHGQRPLTALLKGLRESTPLTTMERVHACEDGPTTLLVLLGDVFDGRFLGLEKAEDGLNC